MKTRVLLVSIFLASLQFCLAQASSTGAAFSFGPANLPVWDLTGAYQIADTTQNGVPVSFSIYVSQDARGVLRGMDMIQVKIGNDTVAASYRANGRIVGGGANTRAVLTVRLTGLDVISGARRRFGCAFNYNLVVNPATLTVTGTARGSVNVAGVGASRVAENITLPLPASAVGSTDGKWNINLDYLTLGNRVAGSGTITVDSYIVPDQPAGLPAVRVLPVKVVGSYSPRLDRYTIRLIGQPGDNDSRGTTLTLIYGTGATAPTRMTGRVLGEAIRF